MLDLVALLDLGLSFLLLFGLELFANSLWTGLGFLFSWTLQLELFRINLLKDF